MDANNQALQILDGVGSSGPIVTENYAGPPHNAYLVRRTYASGTVDYFVGTVPKQVVLSRKWYPSGRVIHYAGDRCDEFPIRETFVPRTPEQVPPALPAPGEPGLVAPAANTTPRALARFGEYVRGITRTSRDDPVPAWPDDLAFVPGDAVRPTGLSRQDLNNRAGVVVGCDFDSGRYVVAFAKAYLMESEHESTGAVFARCYPSGLRNIKPGFFVSQVNGSVVAYLTDGVHVSNVKPENLVAEADYQQNRAARDASRSAKARERADARIAQQLARQMERDEAERATKALAAADAAPFEARLEVVGGAPPTAPAEHQVSPRALSTCPISHQLMAEPVLAADGYVYDKAPLKDYWEAHGYVSPLTGAVVSAFCLPHMPLRSLALEIAGAPTDAKWSAVPSDSPIILECPITHEVMEDPVRAADGNVYDRAGIAQWFAAGTETSPLFGTPMATELRADLTLAAACRAWA